MPEGKQSPRPVWKSPVRLCAGENQGKQLLRLAGVGLVDAPQLFTHLCAHFPLGEQYIGVM